MKTTTLLTTTALGALFTILPFIALAETVVRTGDSVSVEKDQRIEGDFYTAGSILNISGEINGDLSAVAGKNMYEVDLSGFAKGVYSLSVGTEGAEIQTMRIVIE